MYIEPNSYIRLMKNIPLDNTYTDTLFFTSRANQLNYFRNNTTGMYFTAQSYQRVIRDGLRYIRLQVNAENIYDYNYLMFQNTAFGNRWFFAFINNIEYINNNTSEINFELDVMQTWLFDVTLGASYVEREHFSEDTVGMNIQPEPIDIGPIQCNRVMDSNLFSSLSIYLLEAYSDAGEGIPVPVYGGLFNPMKVNRYPLDTTGARNCMIHINELVADNKGDTIIGCFIFPEAFYDTIQSFAPTEHAFNVPIPTTCGNYTPRNNKLLTAPFTFLCVDTLNDSRNYRFEWSRTKGYIQFKLVGAFTADPTVTIYPYNYNGAWSNSVLTNDKNPTESITVHGFTQCAVAIDSYRAYIAQHALGDTLSILGLGLGGIGAAAIGHPIAATHAAVGIAQVINNSVVQSTRGAKTRGIIGGDADTGTKQKGAYFKYMSVTEEYAEIIDDYFDRYGYACNQLKIPNRNARAHWTYCKTHDCNLEGSAPADDLKKIKSIYDNGITWWNNPSEVGHYELLNTPNG